MTDHILIMALVGIAAALNIGVVFLLQYQLEIRLIESERIARSTRDTALRLEATVVMMDAARRMEKEKDRD